MADTTLTAQMLLMPDEAALPRAEQGLGPVAMKDPDQAFRQAAEAMSIKPPRKEERAQQPDPEDIPNWRGMVAAALLCDTWPDAPRLKQVVCTRSTSPFAAASLRAVGEDSLRLLAMENGHDTRLMGIIDPWQLLKLPAGVSSLGLLLPERVTWYDNQTHAFLDPCPLLNGRDRVTLSARLALLTGCPQAQAFRKDLAAVQEVQAGACLGGTLSQDWQLCVKAVAGLMAELPEDAISVYLLRYHDVPQGNALLQAIGVGDAVMPVFAPQLAWCWQGKPFAVSDTRLGVMPVTGEGLEQVRQAQELLKAHSPTYPRYLPGRLRDWIQGHPSLSPEALVQANMLLEDTQSEALLPVQPLTLHWPLTELDPATRHLMRQLLGDTLAAAAREPFSETLCTIRGGALGDQVIQQRCAMLFGTQIYTAVPPVSAELARYTASFGWTGQGIDFESITLQPDEEGIDVSMTLSGTGRVTMTRRYTGEDIIPLHGDQVPRLSLFPSVPIAGDKWHMFYLSVWGQVGVSFPDGDEWITLRQQEPLFAPEQDAAEQEQAAQEQTEPTEPASEAPAASANDPQCRVVRLGKLPNCLALSIDGRSIGVLVFRAAPYTPPELGSATAALDIGATGTAMAMVLGGSAAPVHMPCLWHVLLRGPEDDLSREALPMDALGPVIPSAVLLHGDGDEPLIDGHVCLEPQLAGLVRDNAPVLYDLLWRSDAEATRARRLLLREAMLLCAFHAVMSGADRITWRVTLPQSMTSDGRRRLLQEAKRAADWLCPDCGLTLANMAEPQGLRHTLAAGLQLRDSGRIRGSFMMVDIGGSGTDISLWLRGINRPALEARVELGTSAMLMDDLMRRPELLQSDLSDLSIDSAFLRSRGTGSLNAWSGNRLLLDLVTGPLMNDAMIAMSGRTARGDLPMTLALLAVGFAQLMTVCGICLQQVGEDSVYNDHLPPSMPMVMCGRGQQVLMAMPPWLKGNMVSFIRLAMSRDHRVMALEMTPDAQPKLTGVMGLARIRNMPERQESAVGIYGGRSISVLQLVVRFISQVYAVWPRAGELLFPGLLSAPGVYTPDAQRIITAAAEQSEGSPAERFTQALRVIRQACQNTEVPHEHT